MAVAAVAAQAGRGSAAELAPAAAADLLGMICSAAQRASSPATASALQQAALSCAVGGAPQLQAAVLLLPALALHLPTAAFGAEPSWLQPTAVAVQRVSTSIRKLDGQLAAGAAPLSLGEVHRHVALLDAACLPINVLRRTLAGQLAGCGELVVGCGSHCVELGRSAVSGVRK